jgi:hypothetical protein
VQLHWRTRASDPRLMRYLDGKRGHSIVRRGDKVSVGVKHLLEPKPSREGRRPVALPRGHRH